MYRIVSLKLLLLILFIEGFGNSYVSDSISNELAKTIEFLIDYSSTNTDSAMQLANKSIKFAEHYKDTAHLAELIRLKGLIYFYKVDFKSALEYFTRSKELFQKINHKAGEASAINNISIIYRRQGLLEKTLKLDKQVLKMRMEIGDSNKIAASLNNIAVAYADEKQYDKAIDYYTQAVNMSIDIQNDKSLDLYYNNLGHVHMLLKEYEKALPYFEKSLHISGKYNNRQIYQNTLLYIGEYHIAKENYHAALPLLKEALTIAYKIGIVYEIEAAARNLHLCYAGMNDYENAYKYHRLFKAMADSANSIQVVQKITEYEALAEFEKEKKTQKLIQEKNEAEARLMIHRERQRRNIAYVLVFMVLTWLFFLYRNYRRKTRLNIRLIVQRNEILAQKEEIEAQRDKIEALNLTKDKFFAIIAHDLKNPIGAIYQLSELINESIDFINEEKLKDYVSQINKSADRTFTLLENLLQWATVQTGNIDIQKEKFSITSLINENIQLFESIAKQKQIRLNFNYCVDCFAYADIKMIKTVIRNLLNNAIKFTTYSGNIDFDVCDENEEWVISIKDSGIGISKEDQKQIFSADMNNKSIGNSKAKGTGLGLVLCKEFVELNNGRIWLESEEGKGSVFYFSLPQAKNSE